MENNEKGKRRLITAKKHKIGTGIISLNGGDFEAVKIDGGEQFRDGHGKADSVRSGQGGQQDGQGEVTKTVIGQGKKGLSS